MEPLDHNRINSMEKGKFQLLESQKLVQTFWSGFPKARLSLTHAKITSLAHAYVTCTCKSFYYITCTCTHLLGGVGGVGGMITFLGLAHILECGWWVGRVGWVGGMVTYLDLHT